MKIINVRFKNINTLKGEWEIHFDRSPLKESGLFAITGPNGSGKTTIFDAISLGLYGETFRLKNSPEQIISKQTSACYAAVTFSVNGNVFRSTWSLHATRPKSFALEMKLVELNGNERVLEDNIVAVRSRITELTGLDFKRFSRSIMLPQGEFAALLNALDNERTEILEKIVGPDIYAQFSNTVFANVETENDQLIALKEEIQNFPLLHPSQVEALQENVHQLEDDFRQAEHSLSALQTKEQHLKHCHQLLKEYEGKQIDLANARERKAQLQSDLLLLQKTMDAAPFAADLERLNHRQEKAPECLNTLDKLNAEIAALQDRLKLLPQKDELPALEPDQHQKAGADPHEFVEKTLEIEKKIEALNAALQRLAERRFLIENEQKSKLQHQTATRQAIFENEARLKNTQTWLKQHAGDESLTNNIAAITAALVQLQSIRQEISGQTARREPTLKAEQKTTALLAKTTCKLKKLLNKAEKLKTRHTEQKNKLAVLLDGTTPEALENTLAVRKEQLANYHAMLKIAKAYAKLKTGNNEALETIKQQHDDLLKHFEQEQNILAMIKHVARFEPCRKQLKDREPCPLCGSPEHPYVDGEPPFGRESRQVLREQEHKLEKIKKQIKILTNQITGLKNRHDRLTQIRNQWDRFRQATQTEWALGDLKTVVEAIRALKKDLRIQYRQIKQLRKHIKKTAKLDQAFHKRSAQFTAKQTVAETFQEDLNRRVKTLTALQQEAQIIRKREAELVQKLRRHLEVVQETIPEPGKEDALKHRLEEKRVEYLDHVNIQHALNELVIVLTKKAENLALELDRLQKEADALDKQEAQLVQRILSEKRKLKQATQMTLRNLQTECETLEQNLLNRAASSGFSSLEDLRNSLLSPEQRQSIEQKRKDIEREITQYTANLDMIRKKLDKEGAREMAVESSENLSYQILEARKQKDQSAQALSAALERLKQHNALEKEYQHKILELEKQGNICDRIHAEKRFFETAGEAEIKMRVRELLLERLLENSNKHLGELSGRYYLRRRETQGLALEVEDVLQHRAHRPVNTLSGGESFLVSLSMALGLSDMTGNGRKIESLFIDEGFGCLDDETLYNVLSALKDLKNNGKMVGVISHVKKLEDEIPTKIRITKMPGGVSRLEVVA
ncbi:MAG: SbcC/MukB-like Walker B domain-containing protein [Pseudomonadota bacterium]